MDEPIADYKTVVCCSLESNISLGEEITVIGGSPSQLYLGTSKGRVLHVQSSTGNIFKVVGSVDLRMSTSVSQIELASALDVMIVVCENVGLVLDLKTFQITTSWRNTTCLSLNSHPVVGDPFTLQMAMVTSYKQIHIVQFVNNKLDIKQKVTTEDQVFDVAYSKFSVCFSTHLNYYMYNTSSKDCTAIFSIDDTVMRPMICIVDIEEFMVLGVDSLAIFVTGSGVSNRPPVLLNDPVMKFVYKPPHIIYQTGNGLAAVNTSKSNKSDEFTVEPVAALSLIDGSTFFANTTQLLSLQPQDLAFKVEKMLACGRYEQAIAEYENQMKVGGILNENLAMELLVLKSRIGYAFLEKKEFVKAAELLYESEIDPEELISKFSLDEDSNDPTGELYATSEHLTFLFDFLKRIRTLEYSKGYLKKIDTTLLKLSVLCDQQSDFLQKYDLDLDIEEAVSFLSSCQKFNRAAYLLMRTGRCSRAFDIWKSLTFSSTHQDSEFIAQNLVEEAKRIPDSKTLLEVIAWMAPIFGDQVLEIVFSSEASLDVSAVKSALKDTPQLETYLERLPVNNAVMVDLTTIYLKRAHETGVTNWSNLRKFILALSKEEVETALEPYPKEEFAVEWILLNSSDDPFHALDVLLKEHRDFDAAELVCERYSKQFPSIGLSLLNFYYQAGKSRCDADLRRNVVRVLTVLGKSDESVTILRQLPADLALSETVSFFGSTISHRQTKEGTLHLMKALESSGPCQRQRNNSSCLPITLTEASLCPVCQCQLSYETPLCQLRTGFIVHSSCLRNRNLCPVTNAILL